MSTARRTVLITGTSSGIGLATALACARDGFATVATMRDPTRADALLAAAQDAGLDIDVRQLDVTDPDSVQSCMTDVEKTYGRLDALVNNAGVATSDPTMEMSTMAALRANMEVNFFGVIAVSRLAMPLLRASGGRLVTVGSVHGVVGQPFNESYCAAKAAVEGFMEALAPVAAAHGVSVSLIVPGFVPDTQFGIFPDADRTTMQAASGVYASTFADYIGWISNQGWETAAQPSREVAEIVARTLSEDNPAFRIPTSRWAQEYIDHKLSDGDGSVIQSLARTWIGLK